MTPISLSRISKNPRPLLLMTLLVTISFLLRTTRCNANPIQLPTETDIDACGSNNRPSSSCPVTCFRTNPVCGEDGVTYWCGCHEARCVGVRVAKKGFCGVRNNGGTAAQALLLVHIVWLIVVGFLVLFGLF